MIPVVALVGRPNVGKSTLFNRLTGTQDALVADFPGLTRDRQYGSVLHASKPFIIIDTGGIGVEDEDVDELMLKQSALALEEADVILFLVDAKSGLTGLDESIARRLRKLSKPIFLIVNKAENLSSELAITEFLSLGFSTTYAISASHNRGVAAFLQALTADFATSAELEPSDSPDSLKIAFIGRPNVGKSTLINRMLGEERVVVYDLPGTTRDSISIPFSRDDKNYTLIDTAGIRRRSRVDGKIEKFSIIKTLQSVRSSHICLMLIDAKEGLTEQDMHLLGFIIDAGRGLVLAVNKWDGLTIEHKEAVRSEIDRRLSFIDFAKIRFISALHGSGVGLLFKDINEAYSSATQDLSTPKLTRLLQDITAEHTPPLVNGRRIKLRYAHAGGQNPPIIVIHGNQVQYLPETYKRYLKNAFVKHLNLVGTPLKIEFKGSTNPFQGRKNQLTDRQIKRKKRLMRHVKRR